MFSASPINTPTAEGPRQDLLADARTRQSRRFTGISETGQTSRPVGFGALLLTRFGARVPSARLDGVVGHT
jgi:hypothetical protein